MDERFLDTGVHDFRHMYCITVDSDHEERPVNRYGSPIARRSSGDVGETWQVHSSRDFCRCDCFGLSFEI